MSVFSEIFESELKLNLTDDNSFITKLTDVSTWIIGKGQILSIPNMDFNPTVTTGLIGDGGFTSTATTETKKSLTLERYQVSPYRIPLADELYTAYDKMLGVAKQITNKITEYVHTDILTKLSADADVARYVNTTGTVGVANNPFGGNSKMLKIEDLFTVAKRMDKDKVKKEDRYIVLNPEAYSELMVSSDNINYNRMDFINVNSLQSGVVNKIAGINILVRAEIPHGVTGTTSPIDMTITATHRFNFVAFQKDEVVFALGALNVLEDTNNVFKFADLISAEIYAFAGSPRLATKKVGLYVLQQG